MPGRHKPAPRGVRRRRRVADRFGRCTVAPSAPPNDGVADPTQAAAARRARARWSRRRRSARTGRTGRSTTRGPAARRRPARPDPAVGKAAVRIAVDFADAADLASKLDKARQGAHRATTRRSTGCCASRVCSSVAARRRRSPSSTPVRARSTSTCCRGSATTEPIVADTFREADEVMTPLLGRPLIVVHLHRRRRPGRRSRSSNRSCCRPRSPSRRCWPPTRASTACSAAYGMRPDMVMGHSLGEYGALIAAGSLTFDAALEAVSARGREMASLSIEDNGAMAAVFGPLTEIERIVDETAGLRRRRQHQLEQPGRRRRCHRRGAGGDRRVHGGRHAGRSASR